MATFARGHQTGPAVLAYAGVAEAEEPLTREQAARLRWLDWRNDYKVGRLGPDGKIAKRSIRTIAALYGVSVQAVYQGIEEAERILSDLRACHVLSDGSAA
jgi:hypothetical protein